MVAEAIEGHHRIQVEIVPMAVKGDFTPARDRARSMGLFTSTLEEALIQGGIDMAVHSIKDVPSTLPEELELAAALPRGVVWDGLVSSVPLEKISSPIGVSSPRRRAQWKRSAPHLDQVEISGNIDTRLKKLEEGECTALVQAACGMDRIRFQNYSLLKDRKYFLPAPCQGIIGIEIAKCRDDLKKLLAPINHKPTFKAMNAERKFVKLGEFSCQTPVSCLFEASGEKSILRAELFRDDFTSVRVDLESTSDSIVEEAVGKIRR